MSDSPRATPRTEAGAVPPAQRPLVRVSYDPEPGITTLTLDSPSNRNALSRRMVAELYAALDAAEQHEPTRAVLLGHTGNTFCAGADLSEIGTTAGTRTTAGSGTAEDTGASTADAAADEADAGSPHGLARLLRRVVAFRKPVVARVRGHVRAGGTGLLAACDISVAGPGSSFAFTEARIGLAPAVISLPLLPRLDPRAASRYFLTGERFDAAEAARIGLVTLAAPDPDAALTDVLDGLRRGSPQGLAESKALVTAELLRSFDRDTDSLAALSARLFASAEAHEGMTAFLERRDPEWLS